MPAIASGQEETRGTDHKHAMEQQPYGGNWSWSKKGSYLVDKDEWGGGSASPTNNPKWSRLVYRLFFKRERERVVWKLIIITGNWFSHIYFITTLFLFLSDLNLQNLAFYLCTLSHLNGDIVNSYHKKTKNKCSYKRGECENHNFEYSYEGRLGKARSLSLKKSISPSSRLIGGRGKGSETHLSSFHLLYCQSGWDSSCWPPHPLVILALRSSLLPPSSNLH